MYTLIPEQTAKYLKNEYRIRATILLLLFISLGTWIGIVGLFPSYVLSIAREKKALSESDSAESLVQSASTTAALAQISAANSEIKTLTSAQDTSDLSSVIEDIASRRPSGVAVVDFEIGRQDITGISVVIHGTAATRDVLVAFENNLNADPRFAKVDLPLSDLASDSDIAFTINLTGIQ